MILPYLRPHMLDQQRRASSLSIQRREYKLAFCVLCQPNIILLVTFFILQYRRCILLKIALSWVELNKHHLYQNLYELMVCMYGRIIHLCSSEVGPYDFCNVSNATIQQTFR